MDEVDPQDAPDQRYYWTEEWQENERIAMDEIARGLGRTFENPEDAVRWLSEQDEVSPPNPIMRVTET